MSALAPKADIRVMRRHVRYGPCVDGSGLARRIFTLQHWSEQPCVRPHMMVPLSMAFCRRRSEVSSLLQDFPANLTSGGMVIPTTVPHSGRESFEGTAPLCEDGAEAPRRTTATFPRITGLQCRCSAARFWRRLDGGLCDCTLRYHTVDDEPP